MELDRRTILSFIIVVAFISAVMIYLFRPPTVDEAQMAVVNVLLGALIGAFTTVIAFDFGSSSGSKAKDDALIVASKSGGDVHVEHSTIETTEAPKP